MPMVVSKVVLKDVAMAGLLDKQWVVQTVA